ncbi:MAG: hypothetical protein JW384_04010 [Nitrosomonadaceae bacterium]|nr:hypothetical protein [Nitrosomonadaceae bacterium]
MFDGEDMQTAAPAMPTEAPAEETAMPETVEAAPVEEVTETTDQA